MERKFSYGKIIGWVSVIRSVDSQGFSLCLWLRMLNFSDVGIGLITFGCGI